MEMENDDSLLQSVNLVRFKNPGAFFIRTQIQTKSFDAFNRDLQTSVQLSLQDNTLRPISEKNLKFMKSQVIVLHDGEYKRGKLRSRSVANIKDFHVLLIDEGLIRPIQVDRCFYPAKKFFKCKPFMTRCHLRDVLPKDDTDEWTSEAIDFCHKTLKSDGNLDLIIRGPVKLCADGSTSVPVEVILTDLVSDHPDAAARRVMNFLSPLLIQGGFGRHVFNAFVDDHCEDYSEVPNCLEGLDEVKSWLPPILPDWPTYKEVSITATHFDNDGRLSAQFRRDRHVLRQMDHFIETVYGLEDMGETEKKLTVKQSWMRGEACFVYHGTSETWNRGTIRRAVDDYFEVYLVDFGFEMCATWHFLRVPFHFGDLPSLRLILMLEGLVPRHGEDFKWDEEIVEYVLKTISSTDAYGTTSATKTRDVEQFPIPVQLIVKLDDASQTDVGENILKKFPQKTDPEWPDLMSLPRYPEEIPQTGSEQCVADVEIPKSPFRPAEYKSAECSGWITIGKILHDSFYIYFDYQNEALNELSLRLNVVAPSLPPIGEIKVGVPVACCVESAWYRGYIIQINSRSRSTKANVFLIDEGEIVEDRDSTMLKALPETYFKVPTLTFRYFTDDLSRVTVQESQFYHLSHATELGPNAIGGGELTVWNEDDVNNYQE